MSTDADYFIHESSYVDDGVQIGAGTRIWHFCHVLHGTRIGRECRIGQNVVVGPNVRIGDNVKIQNNVSVYEGVTLADDVFCGPSVVFTNVATPRSGFPRNRPEDFRPTLVQRGASIGANATIVCGTTIGEFALIGAGAVVTRDVPAWSLTYGNPARHRGWACRCGVPLRFVCGRARCETCRAEFRETGTGIEPLFAIGLPAGAGVAGAERSGAGVAGAERSGAPAACGPAVGPGASPSLTPTHADTGLSSRPPSGGERRAA